MKYFVTREGLRAALETPSGQVLIAVNLAMIAGVVAWDWSVFDIVLLYWVENLVIGALNVVRMVVAAPASEANPGSSRRRRRAGRENRAAAARKAAGHGFKLFLVPFFIIHYGGFCYGHGVFVLAMFGDQAPGGPPDSPFHFAQFLTPGLSLAIAALALSHTFSLLKNFLLGGEYRRVDAATLMARPYGRIIALHLTILLGALLTEMLGSPLGLLIVLVFMKTAADLALHQRERQKFGGVV